MINNYKISVITPSHNTKPELFEKGFESLKRQTIGFENVQWVVTLHNCGEEYIEFANQLLNGYDNVKLFELNNDIYSPSSPRNNCLKNADGKYIVFMDADDSLDEECLLKVYQTLEETGLKLAYYNADTTTDGLVNSNMRFLRNHSLLEERMIVRTRGREFDDYTGTADIGIWTKCYDREFLVNNNIFFDEQVPIGEDFLFNLNCYSHLDEIVVMPWLIGYHYYRNTGSLSSDMDKSREEIIKIAKGFSKVFEYGYTHGFYIDRVLNSFAGIIVTLALYKKLGAEDIALIRDYISPYFKYMEIPAESKTGTSQKETEKYQRSRRLLLDKVSLEHASIEEWTGAEDSIEEKQKDILIKILKAAKDTEYGKKYNFLAIRSGEAYSKILPLSTKNRYESYINLYELNGEYGIFEPYSYCGYIKNKDLTRIPLTNEFINDYRTLIETKDFDADSTSDSFESCVERINAEGKYLVSPYAVLGRAKDDAYELIPSNAYFELKDTRSDKTVMLHQAIENTRYLLVVTNKAGLYRFITDIAINVKSVSKNSFVFTLD